MTDDFQGALASFAKAGSPRLLLVTHAWGGGVEQHVATLARLVADKARVMVLRPAAHDSVELELAGTTRFRVSTANWPSLVNALKDLQFQRVHLHHVHGLPQAILDIDLTLGIALDCTLHDYASICPQYQCVDVDGRYCGEPDNAGCNGCIQNRPHAWNLSIEQWRLAFATVLARADRVFAPSLSVARTLKRYFPTLAVICLPHPEVAVASPQIVKVVLLGALAKAKGLSVALAVARHARQIHSPIVLRLIGHAAEPLPATLTTTGSYESEDLPKLIAAERPDVIWLPSQVPETFSFTLSAAMATGIPVVASDIGALGERLRNYPDATLVQYDATTAQWHAALIAASAKSPYVVQHAAAPGTLSAGAETATPYLQRYLNGLPIVVDAASVVAIAGLAASGSQLPMTVEKNERPLLNIFRVGVYGGHQPSARVVEQALESISPGDTQIVGRTQYDVLSADYDALTRDLGASQQALITVQNDQAETSTKSHRALDEAEQRARAAREHIANLEAQQTHYQRIEAAHDELLTSTSWQVTKPLRFAARNARRGKHAIAVAMRLLPRAPVLLRGGISRYGRGGWRSVRDRLATEFRAPETTRIITLPDAVPLAITALSLPTVAEQPTVSILIPVYGQHATTFACLRSIAEHFPSRPFEVIVMDDCSSEPATDALAVVSGVRIIRNETNVGFIGNVNAAAKLARGQWLIILNNDTVVRAGALDALLDTFGDHQNVGLVGAKLLNANGTVQEAGGIVWRDGSAWNWGRNQDRNDPRFNFVRDADYCSGAALAISRDLFAQLGGFDTHYTPAYYEDTDLAFRVRQLGMRVLYQPAAEIFHIEGVSHGRDESSGLKAYQVTNAKKFYERWQQTLASHRENAADPELEAHRSSHSNILIVEACMISPDQDAGSVRMLNLLKILKQDGHHVTFVADNIDGNPRYAHLLTSVGVEVLHGKFAGSVRAVLRERGPTLDSIVICRHYIASQYVDIVRAFAPRARIIFDTVDLHFVREEREAAVLNNPAMLRSAAVTRAKELRVVARSDVTLVVSEFEKELLARIEPAARVEIISMIHGDGPPAAPLADRDGVLFIGGFRHPPNIDAMQWYVREVLPRLRKLLPDVTTRIVGSNMPDDIKRLAQDGLEVLGFVADTAPLLNGARVSIAPLRFGAGIKGKINEAMNHGIPVVATSCAVEGMHLRAEHEVLVADDPQAFAEAIARVYKDAALWNALSHAGIANVRTHFSADAALPAVRAVFKHNTAS